MAVIGVLGKPQSVFRRQIWHRVCGRRVPGVLERYQGEAMFPSTVDRVPNRTSDSVNEAIRDETERRIEQVKRSGRAAIERRLAELNAEWDIERTLEANAATVSLIGVTLGATVDRRWFALPAVVGAFLLQHAVQGWCPPLPVFR